MKKLLVCCAAILMAAAAVFAVDISASVYIPGTLAAGTGDGRQITGYTATEDSQEDPDTLVFRMDGENYGAYFSMYAKLGGDWDNGTAAKIRKWNVWFKPVNQLKVTLGVVEQDLYIEQLHWWKDGVGANAAGTVSWDLRYSAATGVRGGGFNLTYTPFPALTIELGAAPWFGNPLWAYDKDADEEFTYAAWGTTVKYQINDTFSCGIAWRDAGSDGTTKPDDYAMDPSDDYYKVLTLGVDMSTPEFYGFLQPRTLFNQYYGYEGTTLDNYFKYQPDSPWTFEARVPFTYRFEESGEDDPSYLIYELRAKYALNSVLSPFLMISNDATDDLYTPLCFGTEADGDSFADTFTIDVYPGAAIKIGNCQIETGFIFYTVPKSDGENYSWAWQIPFSALVTF